MATPTRAAPADGNRPPGEPKSDDTADWLDWDHWQGVEEIQDIVDGLGGAQADDTWGDGDTADNAAWRRLRRGLYRRGIALED